MTSRRQRRGNPDAGFDNNKADADDVDESQQEWCVVAPGAAECYFGLSGEAVPTFSAAAPWSSLDIFPEAMFASNAPHALRKFGDYLRNRPVVVCVPVTISDDARVRLCASLFSVAGVSAVCLLSEPVACSFASGRAEGLLIFDLGWSHATATFVERGRTTKFVSSMSMGLRSFFLEQDQQSSPATQQRNTQSSAAPSAILPVDETAFLEKKHLLTPWYAASAHLEGMCAKMPHDALRKVPILLAGGGGGCDGLGTALSQIVRKVVAKQMAERTERAADADEADDGAAASSSPTDSDSDDEDDDDDAGKKKSKKDAAAAAAAAASTAKVAVSSIIRIPSHASRLLAFRGASLAASTGVFEQTCSVSKSEWESVIARAATAAQHGVSFAKSGAGAAGAAAAANEQEALRDLISWRFPK